MHTIKDIAALAGVSHGTVSNVLNKKENVSAEKIKLVEKAARDLGFTMNLQAKQLRQGHTKRVCVLIPKINIKQYKDLFLGINNTLKEEGYEIDIYCSGNLQHYEEKLLKRVISTNPTAVVVISSFLKNPGIFNSDTKFIFVERYVKDMPSNSIYMSFDFKKAGCEIAERCAKENNKNIALFCGNAKFSNNKQFINGVTETLEKRGCKCHLFCSINSVEINVAFEIMLSKEDFDAIITDGVENADYLKTVSKYSYEKKVPSIYTLESKNINFKNNMMEYSLNYKLCGYKIAKYIIKTDNEEVISKNYLNLENDGFYLSAKRKKYKNDFQKINMLILSSPTSKALGYLIPEFTKTTGIEVKLVEVEYSELYKSVSTLGDGMAYDLIRIDMVWLSELGKKLYLPLDMELEPLKTIKSRFSKGLSEDYYKIGNTVYTLPFDPSVQVLYYQKDLFENALIKREFYEMYKRQLEVPRTFKEYNEVARFFTRKYNPNSPTQYGTSLVFGSATPAACDYLPRLKELNGKIFDKNGRITININEVKQAMENYLDTYEYTDKAMNQWWNESIKDFAERNTAMNIVFANHASAMVQNHNSEVVGKIGFAAVPGEHPLLGGGVIGISKHSKKIEECMEFLEWVYSEKITSYITFLGGYINNNKLVENIDIMELYPWIGGMDKAFSVGSRRKNNKNNSKFDEYKFENILGVAIRSATLGIQTIQESLEEAQKQCDETFNR